MQLPSSRRTLSLTVVKASNLHEKYPVIMPKYYASVSVDNGPATETGCKAEINPGWNDSPLSLDVEEDSIITVHYKHISSPNLVISETSSCPDG
ncbi:hypothetical protein PILCRDRAFT_828958 [Piloderma croceum F 1598]|uniref:C2 domain-containing protein n=1 Tax=Piloderma croceum (strain F 1598) TaxID=765440 RepID=A0A0C3F0J5_PILCF|nr:hypothetical protein PILCRDRAFT_828958 [Piloderma croceum F 1598]